MRTSFLATNVSIELAMTIWHASSTNVLLKSSKLFSSFVNIYQTLAIHLERVFMSVITRIILFNYKSCFCTFLSKKGLEEGINIKLWWLLRIFSICIFDIIKTRRSKEESVKNHDIHLMKLQLKYTKKWKACEWNLDNSRKKSYKSTRRPLEWVSKKSKSNFIPRKEPLERIGRILQIAS